jgi:hypothetical protein
MGMAKKLRIGNSVGSTSFAGSATGAYRSESEPSPVPTVLTQNSLRLFKNYLNFNKIHFELHSHFPRKALKNAKIPCWGPIMVHLKLVTYYLGLIKGEDPDPVNKMADPDPDRHQNIANPQYWYRCIG